MNGLTFSSIQISRFRGFEALELDNLDRFNLILGRNNVGKTALLEALFLMVGPTNPQLTLTVTAFRGIDQFRSEPEDVWGWLFYDKKMSRDIKLRAQTPVGSRTLTISLTDPKSKLVKGSLKSLPRKKQPKPPVTQATTDIGAGELMLVYEDEKRQKTRSRAFIKETGLTLEYGRRIQFPTSTFVSARSGYSSENPERYSKLEELGRQEQILEPLRVIEPRLKRLAVIVTAAGPMLHGDIGLGRMIPLPLMGEGVGRLMTLLLAIATSNDGIVMIDEIETGLHYSVMAQSWAALAAAARSANVQVFATTHSFECMRAAFESFSESACYDLAVQRLDRADGMVQATSFDREMIETALTSGIEVR